MALELAAYDLRIAECEARAENARRLFDQLKASLTPTDWDNLFAHATAQALVDSAAFLALDGTDATDKQVVDAWCELSFTACALVEVAESPLLEVVREWEEDQRRKNGSEPKDYRDPDMDDAGESGERSYTRFTRERR